MADKFKFCKKDKIPMRKCGCDTADMLRENFNAKEKWLKTHYTGKSMK